MRERVNPSCDAKRAFRMLSLAVTVAARPRPAESSRRPSLCASRNVTAKELPPLLFQESGHYEPQWIPRLGFESSDRLVPSRTTARNSSEWLRCEPAQAAQPLPAHR